MTDRPNGEPHTAHTPGEPGEHPLSVLLFSWMRTPLFDRVFVAALGALCVLLGALELVVRRHDGPAVDGLPVFYGAYGFLAFGMAVLAAWPLSRLLRRPEDYYSEDDLDGDTAPEEEEGGHDR
jgi:hypothetical protein